MTSTELNSADEDEITGTPKKKHTKKRILSDSEDSEQRKNNVSQPVNSMLELESPNSPFEDLIKQIIGKENESESTDSEFSIANFGSQCSAELSLKEPAHQEVPVTLFH